MKQRTWNICLLAVLCLLLIGAVTGYCVLLAGNAKALPEGAAAASTMPPAAEQTAPSKTVRCALCSADGTACEKQAYVISTEAELAYVMSQVRQPEEIKVGGGVPGTDSCYQLNLPGKAVNLTKWSDTSIASARGTAFTGHFNGNGHTVTYAVDGSEGKEGLFPQLTDAVVENLELTVELTGRDAACGALFRRAENAAIRNIAAAVTPVAQEGEAAPTGGIGGTIIGGRMENCEAAVAAPASLTGFGGIVYENGGSIENCRVSLSGESALSEVGGIAAVNGGEITGCVTQLTGTLTAAGTLGGVAATQSGGKIVSSRALVSVPAGSGSRIGGICGRLTAGAVENCYVGGDTLVGASAVGGIAGLVSVAGGASAAITGSDCNLASVGTEAVRALYAGGIFGDADLTGSMTVSGCFSAANVYASAVGGGLAGRMIFRSGSFTMTDAICEAKLVSSTSNSGGAVGLIPLVAGSAGGFINISGCSAYPTVQGNGVGLGGFVGALDCPQLGKTPDFENCAAYGQVVSDSDNAGGFVGTIGGNAAGNRFVDCAAYGSVGPSGADRFKHIGGFAGICSGSATGFTGCSARGNVTGSIRAGGFAGEVEGKNAVLGGADEKTGCTAYGDVFANTSLGGFVGRMEGENGRVNFCAAYGNVTGAFSTEVAGFFGASASVTVMDSTAYGDVTGKSDSGNNWGVGGFIGNTWNSFPNSDQKISYFNGCTAYGNVSGAGRAVGGFSGELGCVDTDTVVNCTAYGSVVGKLNVGGFAGKNVEKTSFNNCVSYGTSVTALNAASPVGGFTGEQNFNAASTYQYVNNRFAAQLDAVGAFTNPPPLAPTDAELRRLAAGEIRPNPKNIVTAAFSASGNGTELAFTFAGAAGYRVEELAVSVDGGGYYTLLVYRGAALVPLPAGSLSCQNFAYVYAAPYVAGSVRVRITLTDGAVTVTKTI